MIHLLALLALATLPAGSAAQEAPEPPTGTHAPETSASGLGELLNLARRRLEAEALVAEQPGAITVSVDERIELFTIIFRLAGIDEFSGDHFKAYAASVDERFAPYADHPAVNFARRMREEVGISADAVVVLAAHLSPLPALDPPRSFEGTAVESRWRSGDAEKFAALARDFARDSNFNEFASQCRPIDELVSLRMQKLVREQIAPDWFAEYFGHRSGSQMHVAVALMGGNISYGFTSNRDGHPNGLYAVMGTWLLDVEGLPVYDQSVVPTIVHEFCHSFVDPSVGNRAADFEAAGKALQPALLEHLPRMRQYYWKTLFEETLVRAVVARYLLEHKGEEVARMELARQAENGFVWIEGVYALLEEYEQNRDEYPAFEQFLHRVIDFFTRLPEQLPELVND